MHTYWDKDGSPIKQSDQAITVTKLNCVCNRTDMSFLAGAVLILEPDIVRASATTRSVTPVWELTV